MVWDHQVVGSSPALSTNVGISVMVSTVACGAINVGSSPTSRPNGQVADLVYASD